MSSPPQQDAVVEAWTAGISVLGQALYHWAIMLSFLPEYVFTFFCCLYQIYFLFAHSLSRLDWQQSLVRCRLSIIFVGLIFMFALLITSYSYIGDPIDCFEPQEFEDQWVEYMDNICWVWITGYTKSVFYRIFTRAGNTKKQMFLKLFIKF